MEASPEASEGNRCGIAWRLREWVPCPPGGCNLLLALGFPPRGEDPAACPARRIAERAGLDPDVVNEMLEALGYRTEEGALCPVEAIASRAGYDPVVVRTLDELRKELDRIGLPLSAARAARTRARRHEAVLLRWREER